MAVYGALAGDAITTARIRDNPHIAETGPIAEVFLGREPRDGEILLYHAAAALSYRYIANRLPPKWRKVFQYVMIADHAVLGIANNCDKDLC